MIIIDISNPCLLKPGFLKAPFKNKTNYRVWWLWFAITYCAMTDYEYLEHISCGNTYWKNKQNPSGQRTGGIE